jgi:hypothetical protein
MRHRRAAHGGTRAAAEGTVAIGFIAAENAMGFHAPQAAARVPQRQPDYAGQGQLAAVQAVISVAADTDATKPQGNVASH